MKAGKSKHEVGIRIRIKNIIGKDSDINGLTGSLTHPFGCYLTDYVGVWLDNKPDNWLDDFCNLENENEFELI